MLYVHKTQKPKNKKKLKKQEKGNYIKKEEEKDKN